MVEFFSPDV